MTDRRAIHPAMLVVGWLALVVGLVTPFAASRVGVFVARNPSCDGVAWHALPILVVSCDQPRQIDWVLGSLSTGISLVSLALAGALATQAAWVLSRESRSAERTNGLHLTMTALGVTVVVSAVLITNPDAHWGVGSWVFFSSGAGIVAYLISLIVLMFRTARR